MVGCARPTGHPPAKGKGSRVTAEDAKVLAIAKAAFGSRVYLDANGGVRVDVTVGLIEMMKAHIHKEAILNGYMDIQEKRYYLVPGDTNKDGVLPH